MEAPRATLLFVCALLIALRGADGQGKTIKVKSVSPKVTDAAILGKFEMGQDGSTFDALLDLKQNMDIVIADVVVKDGNGMVVFNTNKETEQPISDISSQEVCESTPEQSDKALSQGENLFKKCDLDKFKDSFNPGQYTMDISVADADHEICQCCVEFEVV